jgi:hypothetical protein
VVGGVAQCAAKDKPLATFTVIPSLSGLLTYASESRCDASFLPFRVAMASVMRQRFPSLVYLLSRFVVCNFLVIHVIPSINEPLVFDGLLETM